MEKMVVCFRRTSVIILQIAKGIFKVVTLLRLIKHSFSSKYSTKYRLSITYFNTFTTSNTRK